MKKVLVIAASLCVSLACYSQTVSCDEMQNFIEVNGYIKATINGYTMNSSWLTKVTAYSYEYKTYVVAEIKQKNSYRSNTYIFCSIPDINWRYFQFGSYGDTDSYGERFHKYIMDYRCNCD